MNDWTSSRGIPAALLLAFIVASLTTSCASPPLTLCTLDVPAAASDTPTFGGKVMVVEVRRAAIPDYLDSQDILVRDGSTLVRSIHGRWASRFSLAATHFLAGQLAQRHPNALITDQPQFEVPDYRIFITISMLDVTSGGAATLEADWLIVPRDSRRSPRRNRGRFSGTGPATTDQDIVILNTAVLQQLANAIDVASLK